MRPFVPLLLAALLSLVMAAEGDAAKRKRAKAKPARVLVYSGTIGFRHQSIPFGKAVLDHLARLTAKFRVRHFDKPDELTPARLAKSDITLWLSTTGAESPFTDAQQDAYMAWVACGGGHMGVHASTDSYKDWPGWAELTGAFFKTHPITPGSISDDSPPEHEGHGEPEATILVSDQTSSMTAPWHGQDSFLLHDEFYAFDRDPAEVIADFKPLLAFGGFTDPAIAATWESQYASEQPLSWTGTYRGKNRLFYTNLGHSTATWHRPDYQSSLIAAIKWVAKKRPAGGCLRRAGVA